MSVRLVQQQFLQDRLTGVRPGVFAPSEIFRGLLELFVDGLEEVLLSVVCLFVCFRERMRLQKKFQKQFGVRQKWDQKSQVAVVFFRTPTAAQPFFQMRFRLSPD